MPQLMPMYWIMSFLMVFIFFLVSMKFYFEIDSMFSNHLMIEQNLNSWVW